MKILSKYKDYYDYLQGVYGEDKKLILDRREGEAKPQTNGVITLYICDKVIQGYDLRNELFWGKEQLDRIAMPNPNKWDLRQDKYTHVIPNGSVDKWSYDKINCNLLDDIDKTNSTLECPIILCLNKNSIIKYPSLRYLQLSSIIQAKEVWLMLSEWLGKKITENEPIVPIGDDKVRILSHGFDLKQSFRHRK